MEKEKVEALLYGTLNGEMNVRKIESNDLVFVIAFDKNDVEAIRTTVVRFGKTPSGVTAKPIADAVASLLRNVYSDPKTTARLMGDFLEVIKEMCAGYILQHFTEIFEEAE